MKTSTLEETISAHAHGCGCDGCGDHRQGNAVPGWHIGKGPMPLLVDLHSMRGTLGAWRPEWADHPWRLKLGRRWLWIAEPYGGLDDDRVGRDFDHLTRNGYRVTVSAEASTHCPPLTTAVIIEKVGLWEDPS